MARKMVPYSLYLPEDQRDALRKYSEQRQGAEMVRNAIGVMLKGGSEFDGGYNKALEDVIKVIDGVKEIECIAVNGKYLNDLLADAVKGMKR